MNREWTNFQKIRVLMSSCSTSTLFSLSDWLTAVILVLRLNIDHACCNAYKQKTWWRLKYTEWAKNNIFFHFWQWFSSFGKTKFLARTKPVRVTLKSNHCKKYVCIENPLNIFSKLNLTILNWQFIKRCKEWCLHWLIGIRTFRPQGFNISLIVSLLWEIKNNWARRWPKLGFNINLWRRL